MNPHYRLTGWYALHEVLTWFCWMVQTKMDAAIVKNDQRFSVWVKGTEEATGNKKPNWEPLEGKIIIKTEGF